MSINLKSRFPPAHNTTRSLGNFLNLIVDNSQTPTARLEGSEQVKVVHPDIGSDIGIAIRSSHVGTALPTKSVLDTVLTFLGRSRSRQSLLGLVWTGVEIAIMSQGIAFLMGVLGLGMWHSPAEIKPDELDDSIMRGAVSMLLGKGGWDVRRVLVWMIGLALLCLMGGLRRLMDLGTFGGGSTKLTPVIPHPLQPFFQLRPKIHFDPTSPNCRSESTSEIYIIQLQHPLLLAQPSLKKALIRTTHPPPFASPIMSPSHCEHQTTFIEHFMSCRLFAFYHHLNGLTNAQRSSVRTVPNTLEGTTMMRIGRQ